MLPVGSGQTVGTTCNRRIDACCFGKLVNCYPVDLFALERAVREGASRSGIGLADDDVRFTGGRVDLGGTAGGVAAFAIGTHVQVAVGQISVSSVNTVVVGGGSGLFDIVSGGGLALIEASKALNEIPADLTEDEKVGFKIVRRALEEPMRQIAENAGLDGSVIAERAKTEKKGVGFNARTGEWVNMLEAGIIDPAKVTCSALKNAASVAGTLLTTECAITDIPEPKAPAAPAPDMGGMY